MPKSIAALESEIAAARGRHLKDLDDIFEIRESLADVARSLAGHEDPMVRVSASRIKVILGLPE